MTKPTTQIVIALFDDFDPQDVMGPFEVLRFVPGAEVRFAASAAGTIRSEHPALRLVVEQSFADVAPPDVLLVPGGSGEVRAREDAALRTLLLDARARDAYVASVCTGALVLGAAGLLQGKRATTHWLALDELPRFGAIPVEERYVFDGKLVTSAGVSAGIDMALALASELAGEAAAQRIQLGIEYDPAPPFTTGSPAKAPAQMVEAVRARSRFARGS